MPVLRRRNNPATTPSNGDETPPVPHSSANASPPTSTGSTAVAQATQKKAVAQPRVHPLKKYADSKKIKEMKVFCYNCQGQVIGNKVLGHLFFGRLKCVNCCHIVVFCSDFQELYPSKEDCPVKGKHCLVEWEQPVWDFLYYSACRELTISSFLNNTNSSYYRNEVLHAINSYIEALTPLKTMKPWNAVFSDPLIEEQLNSRTPLQQTQAAENINQNKPSSCTTNNQKLNSGSQSGGGKLPTSIPARNNNIKDLQGTTSSSANHDSRGKSVAGIEAAKGRGENSKGASGLVPLATQESKHQKTIQVQQDIVNKANQPNTESSKSSSHTAKSSKAEADRNQGTAQSSLPSASPTRMQQVIINKANQPNTEPSKSSSHTANSSKAEADRNQGTAQSSLPSASPTRMQQVIMFNKGSQCKTESSKSSTHTANRTKEETNRKQGVTHSSLPSASPTHMQQNTRNKASLQNTEFLKSSTNTVHSSKAVGEVKIGVAHPSRALNSPTKKQMPQERRFLRSSPSPQKLKQPQNTTEVSCQKSTQSINSPMKAEGKVQAVGIKAKEETAEDAYRSSILFSRETRQKSQSLNQKRSDLPRGKRKRSPRRKNWYSDFIPSKVLSSGHYLVVVYPKEDCPDECPTCYFSFDPNMCTVNLSTFVANLVCPECNLSIYMVPKLAYDKSVKGQPEELERVM